MSVSVNLVGMTPGGGGSFPMAGTRPKVRKSLLVTSGSTTWVAPANVYFVSLAMCGGGGGALGNGYHIHNPTNTVTALHETSTAFQVYMGKAGGSATCIPPTIIPVSPGAVYTLTAGAPGVGGSTQKLIGVTTLTSGSATGSNGGNSKFSGDMITVFASGGLGASGSGTPSTTLPAQGGGVISEASTFGFTQVPGASGSNVARLIGDGSTTNLITFSDFNGILSFISIVSLATTPTNAGQDLATTRLSVEFSQRGAAAPYSASLIGALSASITFGGAPSLFSDGPPATAVSGSKPLTPSASYGVGGAANAYYSPAGFVVNQQVTSSWTIASAFNALMTGLPTRPIPYGYGGDGGPGMVRIIWEE